MKNTGSNALSVVSATRQQPDACAEAARGAAATGTAVLDRDFRVTWSNACAEAHLGPEAQAGRQALAGESPFGAYLAAGDFSKPLHLQTPRGVALAIEVLPFIDGGWLLLSRDVTASAKAESMRRDFVADTSHELRAPLCVLGGLVETMAELEPDAARMHEYLDLMGAQCKRMRTIVDGLLELSALEGLPAPGRAERVGVATLVARLRAEAEVLSGGRHTILLDAQPGFDLLGSESEIASALGNLVANAVRYTPPGGEVRIVWHASAKGAEFIVEDNGVGIEPQHIPLLTERFYRVQKAVHAGGRRGGGAGLGLAIVKAVLARHQATLEIASEAGKGSRFMARFPSQCVVPTISSVASLAA
jgi:two-component system phosphate regulon sensor histidine kinase PhoR